MKLLIDLSTFGKTHQGGKDEVAYNLLRGFSALGHTNDIICVARPELVDIIHEIDSDYIVIPQNKYHSSGRIGSLLASVTDLLYGLKLRKIVKKERCDRILFTNKLSPFLKQPVKTYIVPHDIQFFRVLENTDKLKLYTRIYVLLIRINFHFCDRIIAISDFDRAEMTRYMPEYRDKLIRIYDPIQFKSTQRNTNRTYITAVNIQHDHKNTVTLVKAFAHIAANIAENLVLVGRVQFVPEDEAEIHRVIEVNSLQNRVLFTGFVDDDELKRIISNTRIFVNPSLFEGFGMAAVEMMESKIPTIVARNSAQAETTLGLCRYYEPATDDNALAEVIMDELNHPTLEQELEIISQKIREKYDYVKISEEYWEKITEE